MLTYEEAMAFLKESEKQGSVLGLKNMEVLMEKLNHPEDKLTYIHVAGTNGKGSTAAYISSILSEAGYTIGRYLSPTLFAYEERIQIQKNKGSEWIKKEEIIQAVSKIKPAVEAMVSEGYAHPTVFEIETAMAFLTFLSHKCDYVVLEVGLGGRQDATNIIPHTKCAVLTSISMDHMDFLGDSLEKITYEKAGIIKEGCHVISYEQSTAAKKAKDPMMVIKEECEKKTCLPNDS